MPFFNSPFNKIGIIGGAGKMGQWFANFFSKHGLNVSISDLNQGISLKELVLSNDVIFFSVPMSTMSSIIPEVCKFVQPQTLLVENCSIKSCGLPLLEQLSPENVEVLGIHGMFGETVPTLAGENVIVTRTTKSGALAQAFVDLLYKHGAIITECSSNQHDQMTALMQSLLHLTLITLGLTIRDNVPSADLLDKFSTPNFRLFEQMLSRILSQQDSLTFDLQALNTEADQMREKFLQNFTLLKDLLNTTGEIEFREKLQTMRQELKIVRPSK